MLSLRGGLGCFMCRSFKKTIKVVVNDELAQRLDKTLTQLIPEEFCVSRSRIKELMTIGSVKNSLGETLTDPSAKSFFGQQITIVLPPLGDSEISPENIKLDILYEDSELLVVDKPAGMVVHPAPGSLTGTLVNALLFHCGISLSGIGGIKRPGIVHRIDKDTSGLLVVAKTDFAHQKLSQQFFKHSVQRKYIAFVFGRPSNLDRRLKKMHSFDFETNNSMRIYGKIARHKTNRKRMAVYKDIGRDAVTKVKVKDSFGPKDNPIASLLECVLETGRTHQIRAHLNYIGHNIIGDQMYKSRKQMNLSSYPEIDMIIKGLRRQALHAASLGFLHPQNGEWLDFTSKIPPDIKALSDTLEKT